ncbi:sporulation integral membrane protein YlbJ [Thalassobacillus sp. CUG 92003]|uniref:sporulation integral membrane protein YlbJ n=1 Tax=Thalassobacillus sp. CUG 92003 TaxID=2736641 RepID=UPI0015E7C1BE|nr:sporulation integral membrane protein YlbJ [Thalassobacillus sp. CUG 92003]
MSPYIKTVLLSSFALSIAVFLIMQPSVALSASTDGLDLWWKVVFPSLLPFFITAELMVSFGVVKWIGTLFEPFMRPLFRVPGTAGFVWTMGMASGFPVGAKLTVTLRNQGVLTKTEAERLVCFSNASNPLFIFGVIAVGFFHDESLGLLLAASHYGGNLLVAFLMRFYRYNDPHVRTIRHKGAILKEAFKNMHASRIEDRRPLGKILGDAVTTSVQTLLMIGGFIILFSVINRMLESSGFYLIIIKSFETTFSHVSINENLFLGLFSGILEITTGSQMVSETEALLIVKLVVVAFVLGFNGFSIQAQVASILANSDISYFPYFISRILHGTFAAVLIALLYHPLYGSHKPSTLPAIHAISQDSSVFFANLGDFLGAWGPGMTITFLFISCMVRYKRMIHPSNR